MSATADAATHALADHHPIGISTGVLVHARGDWPALVAAACRVSTFAVELSALSGAELPGLIAYLRGEPRLPFRYVSVHAPVKYSEPDEDTLAGRLSALPLWVRSIVAHPDAITPAAYRGLGTRLVLENMDGRKDTGQTAEQLQAFFDELPQAGFCLDIAHAHSIDPSMELAGELLDRFASRLRQVHLSSLRDDDHVSVRSEDEAPFADVLRRCRDVPWILEAAPPARWGRRLAPRFGQRAALLADDV